MRKRLAAVPIVVVAVGGSTACATRGFVRTNVNAVNEKVTSLEQSIEKTQAQARKNEARVAEVDRTAQTAQQSATQARRSAQEASQTASEASRQATTAKSNLDALAASLNRLTDQVVVNEDEDKFTFGKSDLSDSTKAQLDQFAARLKEHPKNVYIEIDGYTDNVGPEVVNQKLGLERAEAVERYLYEKHQIPLHRMSVISYGEDKPVAPNTTSAGRAQNRRVVVKVMA